MNEERGNNNLKIVLVGEAGVGKTSIITQFIDNYFEEDLQASTGASFSAKNLVFDNGEKLRVEIWDTAGQERYRSLSKIFFQNSGAVVFVFDITRKSSFEEIKSYWIKQVKESVSNNIIKVLAANKYDLFDREEVDEEEARKFAEENNSLFFLTSAKSSIGINELFIGISKKFMGWEENVELIKNDNNDIESNDADKNFNINDREGTISLNRESNKNINEEHKGGCC